MNTPTVSSLKTTAASSPMGVAKEVKSDNPPSAIPPRWSLRPHAPFRFDEGGNLVFFEYEAAPGASVSGALGSPPSMYGLIFFAYFLVLWASSFAFPALLLWSLIGGHRFLATACIALIAYTYAPIPKRRRRWQHYHFYQMPKYFKSSSFRITRPNEWPELKPILDKLEAERNGNLNVDWSVDDLADAVASIDPPRLQIWLCHPHGFTGTGWGQQAFNFYFPKLKHCVANILYYVGVPVICFCSHLGNPWPVSRSAIRKQLNRGGSMTLVLGGFEEATITPLQGDRLWFKERNGIFKYALQYGADLVPYWTFGESKMYRNVQGAWNLRLWLSKHSIPGAIVTGRFGSWVPHNTMMHIVIGKKVTAGPHHTLETLKAEYLKEVESIYEEFAPIFYSERPVPRLEVW